MKKITFIFLVFPSLFYSQIQNVGSTDYGRLNNIKYDQSIVNHLYAIPVTSNHLVFSTDNGTSWDVFYSYPENVTLGELKNYGTDYLSFTVSNSSTAADNAVYIMEIATKNITNVYSPPIPTGAESTWIISYNVFPSNSDVVLLHQGYRIGFEVFNKVYYTDDGGLTYTEVYYSFENGTDNLQLNNVAISPDDSEKLFLARSVGLSSTDAGLLISNDAGVTWSDKLLGIPLKAIAFNPNDVNDILLGTFISFGTAAQALYRSANGGDDWNIIPISWTDFILNSINGIYFNPLNSDQIIILEENEILTTTDDGNNWTVTVHPYDANNSYYFGLDIAYNPFVVNEVQIAGDFYPFVSTDGGNTLTRTFNPFFSASHVATFNGTEKHLYYSVQQGLIHENLSTNTVQEINIMPLDLVGNIIPSYTADDFTENRVYTYAGGFFGNSFGVSNDNGATSTSLYNTFFGNVQDVSSYGDVAWVSFDIPEFHKMDFTDINSPVITPITVPEGGVVTAVYADQTTADKVFIAHNQNLYVTTDGGTNWVLSNTGIENSDHIYDIISNPNNASELFLATAGGIYKSTNMGSNWNKIYTSQNIRKIRYSPITSGHIAAAAYSNVGINAKIVVSNDNGDSWIEIPSSTLEYPSSTSIDFDFESNSLDAYIGTPDLGILRYNIDLSTLSLDGDSFNDTNVKLFPNPTSDKIRIVAEENLSFKTMMIFSYTGKKIIESNNTEVDLSNLESGLYLVKVVFDGKAIIRKVLKK